VATIAVAEAPQSREPVIGRAGVFLIKAYLKVARYRNFRSANLQTAWAGESFRSGS